MLGVLITLVVAKGCVGVGEAVLRRWMARFDPALRFGAGGLAGLGLLGTITFFLGLIPGGFNFGVYVVGLFAVAGLGLLVRDRKEFGFRFPRDANAIFVIALVVVSLFSLVAALAPSGTSDWDTLAYHLAVPKLWLHVGHMYSVPALHHSNFPDVIDDLYVWGLTWGGQAGAKAFSLAYFLLGLPAIFGFARQRYGQKAGWWAALAFGTVPVVMWETGSAYIDVGHGLFAGLGIAFAALSVSEESERFGATILAGIFLGFAAASKYTGLEDIFIVAALVFAFGIARKAVDKGLRGAVTIGLVAAVLAAPWYVRNVLWVHNPVYPFMYERFGGDNWDQRRADIYRNQQQTFGVGFDATTKKRDPIAFGHSVLGLEYQPGRYVDPRQEIGLGDPMGAVGIAILAALIVWAVTGKRRRFESLILLACLGTFFLWFFLSQQSRYVTSLAPAAAILLGGAVATLRLGPMLAGLTVLQTLYSIYLFQSGRFSDQIPVVLGKVTAEQYLSGPPSTHLAFYEAAQEINKDVKDGKIALFDEVFGYALDVPYMWANPPHSTLIPYDAMKNGDDFVREMKKLGFTHAYINLSGVVKAPEFAKPWVASMGLNGPVTPLPPDVQKAHFDDWQTKWEILLADAVATGKMHVVQGFHSGILFAFD